MTSDTATRTLPATRRRRPRGGWWVAAGLILLSLVPVIAGALRITELSGGGPVTADNARFFGSPVPVIAHIVGATVYCVLGAFQFVPSLRRHRRWHRIAGRVLVPAGLVAAASGVWMAAFYTFPDGGSPLLLAIRLVVGPAMAAFMVLGVLAIRRRDVDAHGAWMTRAYALGIAAGTQAVVLTAWTLVMGLPGVTGNALLMGLAWLMNAGVAELVIARRRRPRADALVS